MDTRRLLQDKTIEIGPSQRQRTLTSWDIPCYNILSVIVVDISDLGVLDQTTI